MDNLFRDGETKKRIAWIDSVKTVCIILVIIEHALPPENTLNVWSAWIIPAFFIISGFLFKPDKITA